MPSYGSNDGFGRQQFGNRPSTRLTDIGRRQANSSAMAALLAEEDIQRPPDSGAPSQSYDGMQQPAHLRSQPLGGRMQNGPGQGGHLQDRQRAHMQPVPNHHQEAMRYQAVHYPHQASQQAPQHMIPPRDAAPGRGADDSGLRQLQMQQQEALSRMGGGAPPQASPQAPSQRGWSAPPQQHLDAHGSAHGWPAGGGRRPSTGYNHQQQRQYVDASQQLHYPVTEPRAHQELADAQAMMMMQRPSPPGGPSRGMRSDARQRELAEGT